MCYVFCLGMHEPEPIDPNYNYIEVYHQNGQTTLGGTDADTDGHLTDMLSNGGHHHHSSRMKKARMCDTHKTEEMRLFCATCSTLVCQFCFLENHRSHRVERIQDSIMKHKKKVVVIVQNLQLDLDKWERFLSGLSQRESNLQSGVRIEEEKINRCVESIVQEVVSQKDRILSELRQNEQPQFDMIDRERRQVNMCIARLTESITLSPINQSHIENDQDFVVRQLEFMSEVDTLGAQNPPSLKNLDTRVAVSQFQSKTQPLDIKLGKLKKSSYENHALIKPGKKVNRNDSMKNLTNVTNLTSPNISAMSASQENLLTMRKIAQTKQSYETNISPLEQERQRSSPVNPDRLSPNIMQLGKAQQQEMSPTTARRNTEGDLVESMIVPNLKQKDQSKASRQQKRVQIVMEPNIVEPRSASDSKKPMTKPKPKPVKVHPGQVSPKGAVRMRRDKVVINGRHSEMFRADVQRSIKLVAKEGFGRFQGASSISSTPGGPIAVLDATMYQIRVFTFHKGNKKYKQHSCFALNSENEPQDIALTPSGLVVVAYKSGVDMYSASGKEKTTIFKTGQKKGVKYLFSEQQDNGIMSVAVTTKFVVLVGNVDTSRITVLSPADGTVIKIMKTPIHPWYIDTNDVHVGISDHLAEKFCVMDLASGTVLFTASATRPKGLCFHEESKSLMIVQGKIVQGKIHQCSIEQYSSTTGEWLGQAVGDMGKGSVKDLCCTAQGNIAVAATASVKLFNTQYVGNRDSGILPV